MASFRGPERGAATGFSLEDGKGGLGVVFWNFFPHGFWGELSSSLCVTGIRGSKKKKKSGNSALELPEWEFFPDETDGSWQSK